MLATDWLSRLFQTMTVRGRRDLRCSYGARDTLDGGEIAAMEACGAGDTPPRRSRSWTAGNTPVGRARLADLWPCADTGRNGVRPRSDIPCTSPKDFPRLWNDPHTPQRERSGWHDF